jgi:hypothetical protein
MPGPARPSFIGPRRPVIYRGRQAFDCWGKTLASMVGQQGQEAGANQRQGDVAVVSRWLPEHRGRW